jgi:hypothetical protein
VTRDEVLGYIRSAGVEPRSKAVFDAFLVWLNTNPTKPQDVAATYLTYENTKPSPADLTAAAATYQAALVAPVVPAVLK